MPEEFDWPEELLRTEARYRPQHEDVSLRVRQLAELLRELDHWRQQARAKPAAKGEKSA